MKRNSKLMRASGILLVLTLMTSCFVGGTFAKYTTKNDANDTARVAKWGVEVEATGGAFGKTYDSFNGGDTVVSQGSYSVVAPGTSGTFGGIKITGEPEVAVAIEATANVELKNWTDKSGNYYCPLVFTIEREYEEWSGFGEPQPKSVDLETFNGLDYGDAEEFERAVENAITGYIKNERVEAGTDLSKLYLPDGDQDGLSNSKIKFSWEWPFDGAEGNEDDQSDDKDTELGNKAADGGDTIPEITLTVTTTVTQIN